MDAYTIYFASAMATTVLLRSLFGAAFPLFSPVMYGKLGDQWACSVFAFLGLACLPVPIMFYVSAIINYFRTYWLDAKPQKHGRWLRSKSKFAWHEPMEPSQASVSAATTVHEKEKDRDIEKNIKINEDLGS